MKEIDPLKTALEMLPMSEIGYYYSELNGVWKLVMSDGWPKFHAVISGRCLLEFDGQKNEMLEPGDVVVVPHGVTHRLLSHPDAKQLRLGDLSFERLSKRLALFTNQAVGERTILLCGDLSFRHMTGAFAVPLLPRVMHARLSQDHSLCWMEGTLRFMVAEARSARPGGEAIIRRLGEIVLIQAIRSWIDAPSSGEIGWLGALNDVNVRRALQHIHESPERNWSVQTLAKIVGMSRSAFSERFSSLVGESVMRYVTKYRMHLASFSLNSHTESQEEIALRFGYQSGAAFSRAFKRVRGHHPSRIRHSTATLRRPGT